MSDADERSWVDAGIHDPASPDADERRELLGYLTERGASLDDLVEASRAQQLRTLGATLLRRSLWDLTARQIAERAGVDVDRVMQVWRVAGLPVPDPDEPAFRASDVVAVQAFVGAAAFFGERAAVEFTRSIGVALATIADSAMATFGINVGEPLHEGGVRAADQARAATAAAEMLVDPMPTVLDALFLHHAEVASQRSIASGGARAHTSQLAVGFVDIVESTTLVQRLTPDDLADAIGAFEQHATEIVASRRGRVVKTLGDEVMFVVVDPRAACDIALDLRDRMAADGRVEGVRGGVAYGALVRGYGDFYGPEVTVAARAVKAGDPGTIVVTAAVREAVDRGFRFRSTGAHALRGFTEPVELFAVERA